MKYLAFQVETDPVVLQSTVEAEPGDLVDG